MNKETRSLGVSAPSAARPPPPPPRGRSEEKACDSDPRNCPRPGFARRQGEKPCRPGRRTPPRGPQGKGLRRLFCRPGRRQKSLRGLDAHARARARRPNNIHDVGSGAELKPQLQHARMASKPRARSRPGPLAGRPCPRPMAQPGRGRAIRSGETPKA